MFVVIFSRGGSCIDCLVNFCNSVNDQPFFTGLYDLYVRLSEWALSTSLKVIEI